LLPSVLLLLLLPAQVTLLASLTQYFLEQDIPFFPRHLYIDVKACITAIHKSGRVHEVIQGDIDRYKNGLGDGGDVLYRGWGLFGKR